MAGHIATASSVEWTTPKDLSDAIKEFRGGKLIDLDPASNQYSQFEANTKIYLAPGVDSLTTDWSKYESVFLNCPFGTSYLDVKQGTCLSAKEFAALKEENPLAVEWFKKQVIKEWVAKCQQTWATWLKKAGTLTACENELYLLIPAMTATGHFQKMIYKSAEAICFFEKRTKYVNPFSDKPSVPPMGSCCIFWGRKRKEFKKFFETTKGYGHVEIL